MRKLNPITALYLNVLEFISFLLIEIGERVDPYFQKNHLPPEELIRLRKKAKRMRRLWRMNGYWY